MKVLIIEDSITQRQLIRKVVLKIKDIEPILAEDALEGFAILRAIPDIRLVILDNQLPYLNGLQFLEKLRSTPAFKKLTIVVSSADDLTDVYLKAGADRVMVKPYSLTKLIDFIELVDKQDQLS